MARMRFGVHRQLEEEANRILATHLNGITSHAAKSDVLTPWKETERKRREVYVSSGSPDAAIRRGNFGRAANASAHHLNSREGVAPASRFIEGSLAAFVAENGWDEPPGEDWGRD